MPRFTLPSFLAVLLALILFSEISLALPASVARTNRVTQRQNVTPLTGPMTLQTMTTMDTSMGPVTEVCTITLTPKTDSKGNQVVEEVRQCQVTMSNGASGSGSASTGNSGTATTTSSSSSSTSATNGSSSSSSVLASTSSVPPTTSSSSSGSVSTGSANASSSTAQGSVSTSAGAATVTASASGITINGVSMVSAPAASASVSASSSVTATVSTPTIASSQSSSSSTSSAGSSSSLSPTASSAADSSASAAAASSSSAAAFQIPGKKLSVLPIGLGVFAGISVIALIVVGLVTYERTKYRKAFRQRKLAEAGANMGYGGMAQRP